MLHDLRDAVRCFAQPSAVLLRPAQPAAKPWRPRRGASRSSAGIVSDSAASGIAPIAQFAAMKPQQQAHELRRRPSRGRCPAVRSATPRRRWPGPPRTCRARAALPRAPEAAAGAAGQARRAAQSPGEAGSPRHACRRARRRAGLPTTAGAPHRGRSHVRSRRAAPAHADSGAPARGDSRGSPRTRARGRGRR